MCGWSSGDLLPSLGVLQGFIHSSPHAADGRLPRGCHLNHPFESAAVAATVVVGGWSRQELLFSRGISELRGSFRFTLSYGKLSEKSCHFLNVSNHLSSVSRQDH